MMRCLKGGVMDEKQSRVALVGRKDAGHYCWDIILENGKDEDGEAWLVEWSIVIPVSICSKAE